MKSTNEMLTTVEMYDDRTAFLANGLPESAIWQKYAFCSVFWGQFPLGGMPSFCYLRVPRKKT
jgi:hypothetical protein